MGAEGLFEGAVAAAAAAAAATTAAWVAGGRVLTPRAKVGGEGLMSIAELAVVGQGADHGQVGNWNWEETVCSAQQFMIS